VEEAEAGNSTNSSVVGVASGVEETLTIATLILTLSIIKNRLFLKHRRLRKFRQKKSLMKFNCGLSPEERIGLQKLELKKNRNSHRGGLR